MADTLNCNPGNYQCGRICISNELNCKGKLTDAKYANAVVKLISNAADTRATERAGGNAAVAQQQIEQGRAALGAGDEAALRKLAEQSMTTLKPDEARAILAKKLTNPQTGQEQSLEEYADWLTKQPGYVPNSGAKAKNEADRKQGDLQAYELPGSKVREVEPEEVDAIWNQLDSKQREWLFPAGAGAPKRDEPPPRIELDWNNDTNAMRKAMLKTMLEQTVIDEKTGTAKILDPWSATGTLDDIAPDLDHIIPLARGGTHGPLNGSDSGNWVWTSRSINQAYKGDRDIPSTVEQIKLAANGDGKKPAEELYESKVKSQMANIKAKVQEADLQEEIYQRMANGRDTQDGYVSGGLPSLEEWNQRATNSDLRKAVLRGLEQADVIPKGTVAAWKDLPAGFQDKLGALLIDRLNTDKDNAHEVLGQIMSARASGGKAERTPPSEITVPLDVLDFITSKKHDRYNDLSTLTDLQGKRFGEFVDSVRPESLRPDWLKEELAKSNGDWRNLSGQAIKWLQEQKILVKDSDLTPERQAQLAKAKARSK